MFSDNPKVGFLAVANKFANGIADGKVLAPAKSMEDMSRLVFNNRLDAGLTLLFMFVVLSVVGFGIAAALKALKSKQPTAQETPYEAITAP